MDVNGKQVIVLIDMVCNIQHMVTCFVNYQNKCIVIYCYFYANPVINSDFKCNMETKWGSRGCISAQKSKFRRMSDACFQIKIDCEYNSKPRISIKVYYKFNAPEILESTSLSSHPVLFSRGKAPV